MIHERWVHVGRDADGEVYVSEGVDLEGMREVRLGDGRRQRFRPDGPIGWLETLTHWTVAPDKIRYVTEEGQPAPAPWQHLGTVEGGGSAWVAPVGTPPPTTYTCPRCRRVSYNPNDALARYCGACHRFEDDAPPPTYPRRAIQWFGSEGAVTMSHDFSAALGDDDDA